MFLGLINQHCKNISYDVIGEKSGSTPEMRKKGNPFLGEELFIHWEKLLNDNPEMTVRLERNYFICCVNLFLGERCLPRKLCICDGKGTELTSYTAETGKSIQEKMLSLPVNETMKTLCIKFDLDLSCLALERIELWGAESDGEALFPIPCHMESSGKRYSVSQFDTIVSEDAEGRLAAEILSERFFEESGRKLSVAGKHPIILRKSDGLKENGYRLEVSCRGALIIGSDLRGLVMGAETFLKLIDAAGSVPETVVEDAPAVSFRGVHLMLPPADQLEFTKRLVKYLLSPMGYNYIILEIAGGMRFDSHPEINEAVLAANARAKAGIWPPFPHSEVAGGGVVEKEDLADLITYIRRFGIDVIPEVQSLGHVQFLTLPHPDIAELPAGGLQTEETDLRLADIPPNDFYAHSFCPSNPKSYMILFDILDEIIEVTKPRKFVHMGHDEVYQIGVCPVCRSRDPAELFASDIRRIHDHLAEKGLRMMIWSDMLQPVSSYRTVHASSMIPKDIVLLDFIWYFHMEEDIETNLTEQNFSVVIGNLYPDSLNETVKTFPVWSLDGCRARYLRIAIVNGSGAAGSGTYESYSNNSANIAPREAVVFGTPMNEIIPDVPSEGEPATYRGVQVSSLKNEHYQLRFIGVIQNLQGSAVGFRIQASFGEGRRELYAVDCKSVYQTILGMQENEIRSYTAESLGGKYVYALSITGIPVDAGEIVFTVTPYKIIDGESVFGKVNTVIVNSGTIVSQTVN